VRKAEIQVALAENDLVNGRRSVASDVEKAIAQLSTRRAQARVAQEAEQTARESLRLARTRQEVGVGTQLEVRDAELKLTQAQLSVVGSLVDGREAESALRRRRVDRGMTQGRWILAEGWSRWWRSPPLMGLRPKAPPPVEVTPRGEERHGHPRGDGGRPPAGPGDGESEQQRHRRSAVAEREGRRSRPARPVLGQIDKRFYETQVTQYRGAVASARAQIAQIGRDDRPGQARPGRIQRLVDERLASAADLEKSTTQLKMDESRLASQRELVSQNVGQLETALYNLSRRR